jgi:hypothetical protein
MSKPIKTEAELIVMARAELRAHLDAPEGLSIAVVRDGASWEFRANADDATVAKPAIPKASPCWCRSATISASSMM